MGRSGTPPDPAQVSLEGRWTFTAAGKLVVVQGAVLALDDSQYDNSEPRDTASHLLPLCRHKESGRRREDIRV